MSDAADLIAATRLFPKRNCSILDLWFVLAGSSPRLSSLARQLIVERDADKPHLVPPKSIISQRGVAATQHLHDRPVHQVTVASLLVYCACVSFFDNPRWPRRACRIAPPEPRTNGMGSAGKRLWLTFLVHRDAIRIDPLGYMQALIWRIRGLRVRSSNRLAALMGRSPHAYGLWIKRTEPIIHASLLEKWTPDPVTILPIIDCTGRDGSSEVTSRSFRGAGAHSSPAIVAAADLASTDCTELTQLATLPPQGTWLCIAKAGDELAPRALDIYAAAAALWPDSWVIYADDDLLEGNERQLPHFKASWNPDLFEHHDFITCSAIIRVTPEMFTNLRGPDWARRLTLRAIARGSPAHLPVVLHHRRERPAPSLPQKPNKPIAARSPTVSVIVPTRNRLPLLKTCVDGLRRTDYPHIELIVVDNDSDERETLDYLENLRRGGVIVVEVPGPFNFSALNNAAVEHAQGELLCFLNNDVEIIDPDWLSLLVRQAIRPELGAIGGRLLYPDGSVQHAGVVLGVGGGAAHAHRFQTVEESGYFLRDRLPQRVSAVTAACLVVAQDKFRAVGGFDEKDFPVAFNDVDLCLKLNSYGWQSFYEPRAVLVHHESKSRGSDAAKENRERFAGELSALKRKWGTDRIRDPFHHPQLSPFCEQFHIAV